MIKFRRKIFKKVLLTLLFAFAVFNIFILISGKTFFYKALYYNFADIDDYKIFSNRLIHKSPQPDPWPLSKSYNKISVSNKLESSLDKYGSIAFLIIKDDSIVHEQYWDGYSDTSHSGSFSMAKSFVSALVGVAIKEGKIKSVEQKVSEFLPEFKEGEKKNIKIKHLLMMSSGLDWNESYANPLSVTTEAYYGDDLKKTIKTLKAEEKPGVVFSYKSGDTQVLSFVIEKATGMSLSEYAEKKLWQPMGVAHDAWWSLDKKKGYEKAYCCINSNARDFARLGYLFLHKGNWKGNQLIDTSYVEASTNSNGLLFENEKSDFYGYQWWIIPDYKGQKIFYARGILGQLMVVIPGKNIVAVRLGTKRGEKTKQHFGMVFDIADEVINE